MTAAVPPLSDVVDVLAHRAERLFQSRELLCAEAVIVALNDGLNGGVTRKQAEAMTAGFPVGFGGSGCVCGAVNGAVLALGLFLGPHCRRKKIRDLSAALIRQFKERYGATCCRVLTKDVKDGSDAHFIQCGQLTYHAARLAAEMILSHRPELASSGSGASRVSFGGRINGFFRRLWMRVRQLLSNG